MCIESGKSTKKIMNETVELMAQKHNIDVDAKLTVLGHVQRGGKPTYKDRIAASRMGSDAVKLLINGIGNRVVALKNGKIVDYDILEGLAMHKNIEDELLMLSKIICEK